VHPSLEQLQVATLPGRGDWFIRVPADELEAKCRKVHLDDGQVHRRHRIDPPEASWDVGAGPKAELPAKMPSKGRCRCSWQTHACVTPVTAPEMASAMPPTRYTGLHVMRSAVARQIQAVKGPAWVMLTPPPVTASEPMTASEALPPPADREKPSPVLWWLVGFPRPGPATTTIVPALRRIMIRLLVRTTLGSTRARMDLTGDIAGAAVNPMSSNWESDTDARAPPTLEKVVAIVEEIATVLREVSST